MFLVVNIDGFHKKCFNIDLELAVKARFHENIPCSCNPQVYEHNKPRKIFLEILSV